MNYYFDNSKWETNIKFRKEGGKHIDWFKGKGIALKRDNILESLLS